MQDIFAHTISRIDFLDGMIRVELALAEPAQPGADGTTPGQPSLAANYALHMPLGGFMRGALVQESFIRELVTRGILPAPNAEPPPAPAPGGNAIASRAGSPNFR